MLKHNSDIICIHLVIGNGQFFILYTDTICPRHTSQRSSLHFPGNLLCIHSHNIPVKACVLDEKIVNVYSGIVHNHRMST